MFRRCFSAFLSVLTVFLALFTGARAEGGPQLAAVKSVLLLEADTNTALVDLDSGTAYSVAGLAKLPAILTLAQAFDAGALKADTQVSVSRYAASMPGPTAFAEAGETLSAAALMKAAVMISAGDAIMALGETLYGSESVFVENINVTLELLGLDVRLTSALGAECVFTARELAAIGLAASNSAAFTMNCSLYLESIAHADGRSTELVNANRMIRSYAGCTGLLTGSSPADGYCGVFSAKRGEMRLIAVVLGATNAADRFDAAARLFDHGFGAYKLHVLAAAGETLVPDVPVEKGTVRAVDLIARERVAVLLKSDAARPEEAAEAPERLEAPLLSAEPVGRIIYRGVDGAAVAEVALYPAQDVEPFGLLDILRRIMRDYIGMRAA